MRVVFLTCLVLCCLGLSPVQAEPSEADLKAAVSLQTFTSMGTFVRDFCDEKRPEDRTLHAQAWTKWQQVYGLATVQEKTTETLDKYADQIATALEATRATFHEGLGSKITDPKAFCSNLEMHLLNDYDPTRKHAAAFQHFGGTVQNHSLAQTPTQNDTGNWGQLSKARVEKTLASLSAVLPLSLGGDLKHGAYQCQQRRIWGETTWSDYIYTLSVYPDFGLRVTDVTFKSKDDEDTTAGRSYFGQYAYKQDTGALTAEAANYDNYDIGEFDMINGVYKPVDDTPDLVNAFRFVRDANGSSYFYGQREYGSRDDGWLRCVYKGDATEMSPIGEAKEEQAAEDSKRYTLRTSPNGGLKDDMIEGYLYKSRESYGVLQGNYIVEDADLLLKDGWAFAAPDFSPNDFDADASKLEQRDSWYLWKSEGGGILTSIDGGKSWSEQKGLMGQMLSPDRLPGTYSVMSVIGGRSTDMEPVIHNKSWTFASDGTFTFSASRRAAGFYNTDTSTGTYQLEGYTLDLKFQDGSTSRTFVFGWGNGDNIFLNGETFSRP
jgi:hypothetical protein